MIFKVDQSSFPPFDLDREKQEIISQAKGISSVFIAPKRIKSRET